MQEYNACPSLYVSGVIEIDRDAAGYGWYIDSAPSNDSSFGPGVVSSPARDHVDLLSVVCHELGHELGFEHDDGNDVMAESLAPGVRHVPIAIRVPGSALGPPFAASTPIISQYPVLLGPAPTGEAIMALDAALAGWSSPHEAMVEQVSAPVIASSALPQDGTAGAVLPALGPPRRVVIDAGSVDAVMGSSSISTLLGYDGTGRPTKNHRPTSFRTWS
jgi:hypothetical protein